MMLMRLLNSYARFAVSNKRLRLLTQLPLWVSLMAIAAPICNTGDARREEPTFESAQIPFERVQELKPESVIQGEFFAVPVSHSYLLKSNEYVHFTVEQKGVNLSVTLLDPHGRVLVRLNNNRYMNRSKRLSWIVRQSGVYSLLLETPQPTGSGSYEVTFDERRRSKPEDRLRLEAEQQSRLALRYKNAGQERRALNALNTAGKLWSALQDRLEQTSVLNEVGDCYGELGDTKKSIESYEQALDLNKYVGSKFEETVSLIGLGDAAGDSGQALKALNYYQQALALTGATGDLQSKAAALRRVGMVNNLVGNFQQAFDSLQQALAISRNFHDREEEARILLSLGGVYESLNQKDHALELWNLALIRSRELAHRDLELYGLLNIGKVYQSLGNTTRAVEVFSQSLRQSRIISNYRGESFSLVNLAAIYSRIGDVRVALKYYEQGLVLSRKAHDLREEARLLYAISSIQESRGEYAQAVHRLNEALVLSRTIADKVSEANTLYLLAKIKCRQKNFSESLKNIEAALQVTESVSYEIENQTLRASYLASAQQHYDFYIDLLMKLDRLHPREGYAAAALQISERSKARTLYNLLVESGLNEQRSDRNLLERERSLRQLLSAKTAYQMSVLGHNLSRNEADKIARDIERLTLEYKDVQNKISRENPAAQIFSQPSLPSLREIQAELTDDTLLLEYTLGAEHSYLWILSSASVIAYELPPRAVIEEAAKQVYRSLTVPQTFSSGTQAEISQADKQYWERAGALSEILLGAVAGELGRKRLLVVSDGSLNYIPFAALPKPSTAYTAEARPLVVDHEIVHLPSASVLVSLRRRNADRQRPTRTIAVIADPVFERDDPRIKTQSNDAELQLDPVNTTRDVAISGTPNSQLSNAVEPSSASRLLYTQKEADEILELLPPKQSFAALGLSANRDLVMSSQLDSFSILHFATHGLINGEYPELSGILLSTINQRGESENGVLQLHDIYSLKLSADLVVLSSCSTALGKNFPGEGLIGLTHGFMAAGAQSVVASLWKVDDAATADLMGLFYDGMLKDGLKPATALRKAQIEMWRKNRWHSPFYWAAFTLQGDWDQAIAMQHRNTGRSWNRLSIILLAGGIGLVLFFRINFSIRSKRR